MGVVTRPDVTCHGDAIVLLSTQVFETRTALRINGVFVGIQSTWKGGKRCERNPARVGVYGVSSADTLYGVDPYILFGLYCVCGVEEIHGVYVV